ncbi:ATP-binding protein [Nocardioides KLBMP 9356]|uniref:Sensor-like histidine kinase SenX3 n=1 Tax=Nocardioides potassii TaxID=2911371 RepID=A0ABS9HGD8_9ACTN|nr:ATP-binding protein [Nocardioides potassii]MCF6379280.1 ATP-binding protein [Nocardioides potassii]
MSRMRWTDAHTFVAFAVLYALAIVLGRATVLPGESVSLATPAAGVAVLWLLLVERQRYVLVTIAAVLVPILLATGASPLFAVFGTVAALLQASLIVFLLRRWVPGALGTGGTTSIHSLPVLLRGTGVVVLGCIAGTAVGTTGLWLDSGSLTWTDVALWFGRQVCGVMIVASVGHLTWERLRGARPGVVASDLELGVLWATSVLAYGLIFSQQLPLAFLAVPLSVWCAKRFSTLAAAVHAAAFGAISVTLTILGYGPFTLVADPAVAAILTQSFTLVVLMTALVIATMRDQREDLVAQLVRAEATAAARADLLTAMTQAMSEGLVLVDESGAVVRTNASAREMFSGMAAQRTGAEGDYELLRSDGTRMSAAERPSRRVMVEGHVPPTDIIAPMVDGSRRIVSVQATRLPEGVDHGSGPMAMLVFRDVTAERAESSRLSDFAEVTAHDLRSPLTTVRAWVSMATTELTKPDPSVARAHDLTEKALTGVVRLGDLIDGMLDHAMAAGAELVHEPIELAGPDGLVQDVADLLAVPKLSIRSAPSQVVVGDERVVRQVFANLLGNAVKYAAPGRAPAVEVHMVRRGSRVVVDVCDNGRGIPEADREAVFDRFKRSASATSVEGAGIGLSICRLVVERHGGTIVCTAGPDGVGTRFTFDLPADGSPATV